MKERTRIEILDVSPQRYGTALEMLDIRFTSCWYV